MKPTSISIKKRLKSPIYFVAANGQGDSRITLWASVSGEEAIETNGDAVFETDQNFAEVREAFAMRGF